MKRAIFILVVSILSLFAKDYAKIYSSYCVKCHGKDGSKVVKRYHVNYKPINQMSEEALIKTMIKYSKGEVVYKEKTSRIMKKNLEKKRITSPEDIKGMAKYIKENFSNK